VHASQELFDRLKRLEERQINISQTDNSNALPVAMEQASPVREMQEKLRQSLTL
jgi:hypothetical protein